MCLPRTCSGILTWLARTLGCGPGEAAAGAPTSGPGWWMVLVVAGPAGRGCAPGQDSGGRRHRPRGAGLLRSPQLRWETWHLPACPGDTVARDTDPPLSRVPLGAAPEKPHVRARDGGRTEDGGVHGAPQLGDTALRGGACRTAGGLEQPSWLLGEQKHELRRSESRDPPSPCSPQDVTVHRGRTWCHIQAAPAPYLAFILLCGEVVK